MPASQAIDDLCNPVNEILMWFAIDRHSLCQLRVVLRHEGQLLVVTMMESQRRLLCSYDKGDEKVIISLRIAKLTRSGLRMTKQSSSHLSTKWPSVWN